jgi:ATP phosphoribosyltransferase regulatory subunit
VIKGILAPYGNDASLLNIINSLRLSGDKVIQELPGHDAHIQELGCDRKLVNQAGQWQVVSA